MILRRSEFKRKRWYKRRQRRRNPLSRLLKHLYSDSRKSLFPIVTPLIAQLERHGELGPAMRWGGTAWSVEISPEVCIWRTRRRHRD